MICDVAMPEMDGFEVLARLQENPATAVIPVLLLTAQVEKSAIQHGLDMGATDYILFQTLFVCRCPRQSADASRPVMGKTS